jgi:hypothetical protein
MIQDRQVRLERCRAPLRSRHDSSRSDSPSVRTMLDCRATRVAQASRAITMAGDAIVRRPPKVRLGTNVPAHAGLTFGTGEGASLQRPSLPVECRAIMRNPAVLSYTPRSSRAPGRLLKVTRTRKVDGGCQLKAAVTVTRPRHHPSGRR